MDSKVKLTFQVKDVPQPAIYHVEVAEGMNAFVAMLAAMRSDFDYDVDLNLGIFVTEIKGVKAQGGAYWRLEVDG